MSTTSLRRRVTVLALALLGAGALYLIVLSAPSSSKPSDQSPAARGTRALRNLGYRSVTLTCKRGKGKVRATCRWKAAKAQKQCTGSLAVNRKPVRGRLVKVGKASCKAVPVKAKEMMQFGFNAYTDPGSLKLQAQVGATVRRLNVSWTQVQPLPGQWNWTAYDRQYQEILDAGLKPLVMVFAAPCWSRPSTSCDTLTSGPPDPRFDPQWKEFVHRVTLRYPQSIAIEVWSEPNLDAYFAPKADPVRYTTLLKDAYAEIKSVSPAMRVVSGGLVASGEPGRGPAGMGDKPFLTAMYGAGAAAVMDGIGTHPYPYAVDVAGDLVWDPPAMTATLDRLRSARDAAGGKQTLWITELGESTTTQSGFPPAVSPEKQAADMQTMLRTAIAAPDVPVVIIHTLTDAPHNTAEGTVSAVIASLTGITVSYVQINGGFGIFNETQQPKPAACVVSRELGGTLAC
jgi:hypothetical protein